ncbi:MAG: UbiA prenyltransferase family protein [Dehalococcoidia bacterium]
MGSDYALTPGAVPRERGAVAAVIVAMRPDQWPKNLIVLAALAFSAGDAWSVGHPDQWWPLVWRSAALAALWCLTSSAVYLVNDIKDRAADSVHPRKRTRPIAAGELSPGLAGAVAAGLLVIALPPAFALSLASGAVLAGYAAVMMLYSFGLKTIAILDVLILCGGVVARAVSGATAIDVAISPWLYVCTSFAAFFLGSSKRWAEFRQLGADAVAHRPSLAQYNEVILGQLTAISAATALLSYALYTIESENVPRNGAMAVTIPFAAFAMFRFLLLLGGSRRADAPDRILFTDGQILLAMAGFAVAAITVLSRA